MTKYFYLLIISILSLAVFSGCEKDVKVSGIVVEPKDLILSKGDVVQLACMVTPYSADNKSVRWESKDVSVVTVSGTGLVTAIAEGETQIVVTTDDGHFSDTVFVMIARGSPAGDSIALVKLYEIATNLPAWDLTKSMDTWEGVILSSGRRVLHIHVNNSYGEIYISKPLDASIANLACLQSLILSAPYATSAVTIPSEIGTLTELQWLFFFSGFTGTIPPELGNLTKLERIAIYDNTLTGGIPKELSNLTNLQEFYLVSNALTGNIPKELGNFTKLKTLTVEYNLLTGEIPQELGNLTQLTTLRLNNNQLTGNIPKELGNLDKLEILYLQNNQLTGFIPQELENLKFLDWLGLSHNSLFGHIPQSLLDKFKPYSFCPQNGTNFNNLYCGNK